MSFHQTDPLTQAFVDACEQAARAVAPWIGKGDKIAADQAATDALRAALASAPMDGTVVIGEGEMDEAPMLYIGEKVGLGDGYQKIDIAVDPLDGTTATAKNLPGAICVAAFAPAGELLHAPDMYMAKLAYGPGVTLPPEALDAPMGEVLQAIAQQLGKPIERLRVCALERSRHQDILDAAKATGAEMRLIQDGDVMGALLAGLPNAGEHSVDVYIGSGGAPEGVLAAAGLRALGGNMHGRLMPMEDAERKRLSTMGWKDPLQRLSGDQLASANSKLVISAVTDTAMLAGVSDNGDVETLVI